MSAFQEYPDLRVPLRDELVGSILPNAQTGQAGVPVHGEHNAIRAASSLVLQMLQV